MLRIAALLSVAALVLAAPARRPKTRRGLPACGFGAEPTVTADGGVAGRVQVGRFSRPPLLN